MSEDVRRSRVNYKAQLIDDLASGVYSQQQLADMYGFSQPYISRFKIRHQVQIEARALLTDEQRTIRGAKMVDHIDDPAERVAVLEKILELHVGNAIDPKSARIVMDAMRQASEELGQLPQRRQVTPQQHEVTFRYEGVDVGEV